MNKRMFSLLAGMLAALMLLSACGEDTPASSSSAPDISLEPAISTLAPVEPEPLYTNPLTGCGTDVDLSAGRPVAIMLNNLRKALPQCGIAQADLIYEVPAEGGITRMMAVFQSLDGVDTLGSVRSARPYYVELAAGLDAIFIHAGGSDDAYSAIKKLGVFNIDGVNGPYGGTMFYRDSVRKKTAGFEHSLFTSRDRIEKLLSGSLSKMRQVHKDGYSLPLTFAPDGTPAQGAAANGIDVEFSYYKTGRFTYDPDSKTYLVDQHIDKHDMPYVDGSNDQQVAVTNVLVLRTDIKLIKGDSAGRLTVRLTGSGSGYFACGGAYIPINWTKESASSPFRFSTMDGQPLTLGAGTSYINIIDNSNSVFFR